MPKALEVLARIQNPKMSKFDAEELVRSKFSYLIGYQNFANFLKSYQAAKDKIKKNVPLTKEEREGEEAVFNIKHLKKTFPELRIAYPDFDAVTILHCFVLYQIFLPNSGNSVVVLKTLHFGYFT